MKVDVSMLLGAPYRYGGRDLKSGVDCLFASRAALGLVFEDLEPDELPMSADEEEVMLLRVRSGETRWHKIGSSAAAARKLGDLIQGRRPDGGAFVAVLIDQLSLLAITADPQHGVHLRPLRNLAGVEAVFRRGAA